VICSDHTGNHGGVCLKCAKPTIETVFEKI
jgi:hypothetical protein